jgi:hypothetical protein
MRRICRIRITEKNALARDQDDQTKLRGGCKRGYPKVETSGTDNRWTIAGTRENKSTSPRDEKAESPDTKKRHNAARSTTNHHLQANPSSVSSPSSTPTPAPFFIPKPKFLLPQTWKPHPHHQKQQQQHLDVHAH